MYKHITLAACLALAACNPAPKADDTSTSQTAKAGDPTCPDDGPRLPGSGVCQGRAINHLTFDSGERPQAPDGCTWVVNETALPGGEYLLYQAARCGDTTAGLTYEGGAQAGILRANGLPDSIPVTVIPAKPDGRTAILNYAKSKMTDSKEAARCRVREDGGLPLPADALVVDEMTTAESDKIATEGIRTACGPFGLDQDSQRFWRIIGDRAWFFDLGQDSAPIDPGSLTIYRPQSASSS